MSSIVQQGYDVAAEDGAVLGLVPSVASLFGSDTSPPAPTAAFGDDLWAVLRRGQDVPVDVSLSSLANGTRSLESDLEWWCYDPLANAGYVRLRPLAVALVRAYAVARRAERPAGQRYIWSDPDTDERVYWLGPGTRWEAADQDLGNLIRVRVPFRYLYAGQWP